MGKLLFLAVLVLGGYFCFKGGFWVSAPVVNREGNEVRVGAADGDWARFAVMQPIHVEATAANYEYNSFGPGGEVISGIGGRALLSYMGTFEYDQMLAIQGNRHDPLENYLAQAESSGVLRRLVLIPETPEVMSQIKSASLEQGSRFHLIGHALSFREGVVNGRRCDASLANNNYFLVASLDRD